MINNTKNLTNKINELHRFLDGKQSYFSFQVLKNRLEALLNVVRMHIMNINVNVQSIEKDEIEIDYVPTGNKLADQLAASHMEDCHVVKLLVDDGDQNSFIFTHMVHPIVSWNDSVITSQAALLNFAVALQARLNHPIR